MLHPYRKLLVVGLNGLLAQNLISLGPAKGEEGYVTMPIAGVRSLVIWQDAGFDELMLSVWWDYDKAHDPNHADYGVRFKTLGPKPLVKGRRMQRVIGAAVTGWLERRTGAHLMGKGSQMLIWTYMRAGSRAKLDAMPNPVPCGFRAEGKVFM